MLYRIDALNAENVALIKSRAKFYATDAKFSLRDFLFTTTFVRLLMCSAFFRFVFLADVFQPGPLKKTTLVWTMNERLETNVEVN